MLNVFGKDYGWNFRTILSCHHFSQTAILGLYNEANDNCNLLSHILLIFKYYIYISSEKRILNIYILIASLIKVKKREKQISTGTINKREAYNKKVVHYRLHFTSNVMLHREKHTGWVGRGFLLVLFVCMLFLLFACMLFYIYLFISVIMLIML